MFDRFLIHNVDLLTLHGGDGLANAAHAHAPLEPDVATLSPVSAPGNGWIIMTTEESETDHEFLMSQYFSPLSAVP